MRALLREILLITHRRNEETRYIISNKGIQRNLYWMAELQSGSEFAIYCAYSKVRPKAICPFRVCVIGPLIWAMIVMIYRTTFFSQGKANPLGLRRRSAKRETLTLWMYVRCCLPSWRSAKRETLTLWMYVRCCLPSSTYFQKSCGDCQVSQLLIGGFHGDAGVC